MKYRITDHAELNNGNHAIRVVFTEWAPVMFELTLNRWGEPVKGLILDNLGVAGKATPELIIEIWEEIKFDRALAPIFKKS